MKGPPLPSRQDLVRACERATWFRAELEAREAVLFAQWSRLDARLGEILSSAIAERFEHWNPYELFKLNSQAAFPQAFLVVCEFARARIARANSRSRRAEFEAWLACVSYRAKPAPAQAFFVPMGSPKPDAAVHAFSESLAPYLKWGCSGRDDLSGAKGPERSARRTLLKKEARLAILRTLLEEEDEVTVGRYLQACQGRIHLRTAERDLRSHKKLRPQGRTRARVYRKTR